MSILRKISAFAVIVLSLVFLFSCGSDSRRVDLNTVSPNYSFTKMNEEDAELIIRLCHFEMKGKSLLAKTAFCATVLNRLSDGSFPDTVDGVVFEPGAFKSTVFKSFEKELTVGEIRQEKLALYYALEKEYDPTGGALFCRECGSTDAACLVPSLTVDNLVFGNPSLSTEAAP